MAIILGSGLGGLTNGIKDKTEISYNDIPHFPQSTVQGHEGTLIIGRIADKEVVVLNGRIHFYEGYTAEQIVYPIRVLKELGVSHLLLSNAAGAMNPHFKVGDIMVITDHINLIPNPLIGHQDNYWGERFVNMLEAYDQEMIQKAYLIAKNLKLKLRKGIYVALSGPTYETPAEYRFLRIIGADAVGMSTTPEVITARQMNIKCFAVSVITDLGIPGKSQTLTHDEVLRVAKQSQPKLTALFLKLLEVV